MQAVPIRFHGYELTFRDGRVWVRIGERELAAIRERFLRRAVRSRVSTARHRVPVAPLSSRIGRFCYQLFGLLREVNRLRKAAGSRAFPSQRSRIAAKATASWNRQRVSLK